MKKISVVLSVCLLSACSIFPKNETFVDENFNRPLEALSRTFWDTQLNPYYIMEDNGWGKVIYFCDLVENKKSYIKYHCTDIFFNPGTEDAEHRQVDEMIEFKYEKDDYWKEKVIRITHEKRNGEYDSGDGGGAYLFREYPF